MNARLLSERRRELGLSVPQLARSVGITQRLVNRLEDGGATDGGDETISIKTLRAVANGLGLAMARLLTPDDPGETGAASDGHTDSALIANILARVGEPVSRSQLATALAWDGERINRAVTLLPDALRVAGLCYRATPEGMTTAPAWDASAQAAAADIKRRVINDNHQALGVIWKVWQTGRELLAFDALTASERALACELVASHVLDINPSGDLCLDRSIYRDLAPAIPLRVRFCPGEY